MAVAENAGAHDFDNTGVSSESNGHHDPDKSKPRTDSVSVKSKDGNFQAPTDDQSPNAKYQEQQEIAAPTVKTQMQNNMYDKNQQKPGGLNGVRTVENGNDDTFKNDMRDLVEILSKLNPMAREFFPPSLGNRQLNRSPDQNFRFVANGYAFQENFVLATNPANDNGQTNRRKRHGYGQGKRRMNSRTSMAQREEAIRKTVYVSDIDQAVTEEQLAGLFLSCGQVVDCRICGDPNSVLRFAFVEFYDEESARAALQLSGTMLGFYPVKVLPSKTAIAPVNPIFLPRSEDEREMCTRTIYCTNIDKKVTQSDVKLFFEAVCGEVQRLRLLGDYHHSTRIAFVEFTMADCAISALNCSGAVLGSLPIRVSPSKTPVRPRAPRPGMH